METTQEINLADLKAAVNLLSNNISNSAKPIPQDPEELIEAEIKKKGGSKFTEAPTTPNSINNEVADWLNAIEPEIRSGQSENMANHANWLFDLCMALINERAQVDADLSKVKQIADWMMMEWMRTTMGLKGEPMGRKMKVQEWDGGSPDPTVAGGHD